MSTTTVMLDTTSPPALHKGDILRSVVGVTCIMSILGSFLIIFSYILFKDIRTKARLILFHLSLTDLGVAVSNFVGDVVRFERFYTSNHTVISPGSVPKFFCEAQAFCALYFTISSILWTSILAFYMYFLVLEKRHSFVRLYMYGSYVICYGIPLLVCIWMIHDKRLGYAPYNASGWCTLNIQNRMNDIITSTDIFIAIFAYDLWITLTIVLIVIVYLSTHYFIRQERALQKISMRIGTSRTLFSVEFKFLLIPAMFILLRMWSLISNICFIYIGINYNKLSPRITTTLDYFTGIGDTGQGAVNGLIFVLFTRDVRKKLRSCACIRNNTNGVSVNAPSSVKETDKLLRYGQHSPHARHAVDQRQEETNGKDRTQSHAGHKSTSPTESLYTPYEHSD